MGREEAICTEGTPMSTLDLQLRGWRLTTAEILYHMPDHPGLLQTYIWQDLDKLPDFPQLKRFLDFWERKLEGRLHSVKVASCGVVKAAEIDAIREVGWLH